MEDQPSILFSDNHLLVAFKPAGMCTQPGEGRNLEEWVKRTIKEETKKSGNVFAVPIHRLDKPVSGLVLFARSSKALSRLNEMMRERKIKKRYLARIDGTLPQEEGRLEHHLLHADFHAKVVDADVPDAKQAILTYRQLVPGVVEVELETGRYHQIRAQLAAVGCPILGDTKYGSKKNFRPESIALQHMHLELSHPVTKENLTFVIPKRSQIVWQ